MSKYKVKGTDILHNKLLYAEGSTIELNDDYAKQLADYLELIQGTENETPKQEEVKQAKPARVIKAKPKTVKENETSVEPKKETEVETISATNTPVVQAKVASTPATSETKPKNNTQVPPAAQKVIANAISQVNKNVQGETSYKPSAPTNMRSE